MGQQATDTAPRPPPRAHLHSLIYALWTVARTLALLGLLAAAFILASALAAARGSSAPLRAAIGLILVLGLPLLLRAVLRRRARRRGRRIPRLGGWFLCGWNLALGVILCCSLAGVTGRALTRHGDWILGAADGWFPHRYRPAVRAVGAWLTYNLSASGQIMERSSRSPGPAPDRRAPRRP